MKSIKCFAIKDHGVLRVRDFPICDARGFENYVTTLGGTTRRVVGNTIERIYHRGFDPTILVKPLNAIPELEIAIENDNVHFITVRWS